MNRKFIRSATCLLAATVLFTNCASIVSKTTNRVNVRTDPDGASVSITNKKGVVVFKGQSPAIVSLKTGAGFFAKAEYQVKISAPGYTEQIVPINYKLNGWYFGNLLFGGLIGMLIVDPATGAMWKITDPLVQVKLERKGVNTLQSTTPRLEIVDISHVPDELKSKLVRIN